MNDHEQQSYPQRVRADVSPVWEELRFRAMNTDIHLLLAPGTGNRALGNHPLLWGRQWFESCEARFSRFRSDSELSQLNRSAGRPMLISAAMLEVLGLAEDAQTLTKGVFTPFVLEALELAGYDRSYELLGEGPAAEAEAEAAPCPVGSIPPRHIQLEAGMSAAALPPGTRIDLGGIAKGWTAERLAGWLQELWGVPRGFVNAGGDVRVWGGGSETEPWPVDIADPWRPDEDAACIALHCGAVATSSVRGRRWGAASPVGSGGSGATRAPGEHHHLIDPRTGRPSTSDVVQCSVAVPSLIDAEVAAKTVCILGSEAGAAWLKRHAPQAQALLFMTDGSCITIGSDWEVHRT